MSQPTPVERTESYARRTLHNVAWLSGSQFIRQFIAIGTTIVLARFLTPTDYGIFAMTLFVNELAQLFIDFGLGAALVQRKQVDDRVLSTCFWINMAIGGVAALAILATSPLAAAYFKQPMVERLLWVSAANLGLAALAVLPQAILSRQLAFDKVAKGTAVGSLIGAAATIGLAASGAGIWSLVFQPLIGTAVNLAYLVIAAKWRPKPLFDLDAVTGLLKFSGHLLIGNLINHLTRNLQQLIVAPVIGAGAMGLLAMATTVAWLPVAQFTAAAVRAIYPVFSRMQDSSGRVSAALGRTLEVVALLAFPVLVGLALLAGDLMPVVFGRQWSGAAPLVSVLCVLCLVHSISFLAGSALLANGHAATTMRIALLCLPLVGAVLWLVRDRDIFVVTCGLSVAHAVAPLLTLHYALKSVTAGWVMLRASLWRSSVCTMGMACLILAAQGRMGGMSETARLVALTGVGAVSYLLLTWLINRAAVLALFALVWKRSPA